MSSSRCPNVHYHQGKLTLGDKCGIIMLDNTGVTVLSFIVPVGNVFPEPTTCIMCVILSSREEHMYICISKLD